MFLFEVCVSVVTLSLYYGSAESLTSEVVIPLPAPGPNGVKHNDYRCSSTESPLGDGYIIGFEPRADPRLVHHMLIFGCARSVIKGSWDCKNTGLVCKERGDHPQILFAWALNASGLSLPPDVGIQIGPSVGISNVVVQIHYGHAEEIPDISSVGKEALILHTTTKRQQFIAGIYILGSGGQLKAGQDEVYIDAACKFTGPKTIYPFAFRTHSHSLGKQIVGYVYKPDGRWEVIGTRSPQDAQAFYPVGKEIEVVPQDWLAARCVFTTKNKHHSVKMGANSEDEMCNFYIMYYTYNDGQLLYDDNCWFKPPRNLHFPTKLPELPSIASPSDHEEHDHGDHMNEDCPPGSDKCPVSIQPSSLDASSVPPASTPPTTSPPSPPSPPSPASPHSLSPHTDSNDSSDPGSDSELGKLVLSEDWALNGYPIPEVTLGQVTAAAVDGAGNLHILHRGPVTWNYDSFDPDYNYLHVDGGPITVSTLIKFSGKGTPELSWGRSLFYMPHGLTIDHEGRFWVTDVAMHQVFRFDSLEDEKPDLVLGKRFQSSNGYGSFCQPTSVAVEKSGVFYVADGYCNHRIMKFSSKGQLLEVWQVAVAGLKLFIPHKAILNVAEDILYVADRENGRIISYNTSSGGRGSVFCGSQELQGYPYAVYFNSSESDWPMYGVYGRAEKNEDVMGFSIDKNGRKISTWGPDEGFSRPHDLVVDQVHNAVYVTEIGPNKIWKFSTVPSILTDIYHDLEDVLQYAAPPDGSSHQPHLTEDFNSTEEQEDEEGNIRGKSIAGINVGVVVAVLSIAMLVVLVTIGVIKEHRLIKFNTWRCLQSKDRDTAIGVTPSGTTTQRKEEKDKREKKKKKRKSLNPRKKLQSLLGPSQLGFSRLKNYDSNSEEDEEFPVFNRV